MRSVLLWKVWTGETRLYDDYRKMLDEVQPHIVAICTPFPHNAATTIHGRRGGDDDRWLMMRL